MNVPIATRMNVIHGFTGPCRGPVSITVPSLGVSLSSSGGEGWGEEAFSNTSGAGSWKVSTFFERALGPGAENEPESSPSPPKEERVGERRPFSVCCCEGSWRATEPSTDVERLFI